MRIWILAKDMEFLSLFELEWMWTPLTFKYLQSIPFDWTSCVPFEWAFSCLFRMDLLCTLRMVHMYALCPLWMDHKCVSFKWVKSHHWGLFNWAPTQLAPTKTLSRIIEASFSTNACAGNLSVAICGILGQPASSNGSFMCPSNGFRLDPSICLSCLIQIPSSENFVLSIKAFHFLRMPFA